MTAGAVWKLGDDIDTDQIIPSQHLLLPTIEEMARFALEPVSPAFAQSVAPGDILVAGENFGSGSSREQAPRVLKQLGLAAVIARSFARIFFRNAINVGLPVVLCSTIYDHVADGDRIKMDLIGGKVTVIDSGQTFAATELPEHVVNIIQAGGLIELLNQEGVVS
jgi:3-isopropylmalate/(R)-2-methylmalate dehydratase small subunit